MKVTALGSADAFCAAGRGNTAWLVEDAHGLAAIDFGPTALLALRRGGFEPSRLEAVHFTHLHADHVAGWPLLLLDAVRRSRRSRPLIATGPPGTRERLHALWTAACSPERASAPLPFELAVVELSPGDSVEVAGRRIVAHAARHQRSPQVALSLRVESGGLALAFTGDTGAHPGLAALAAGADLLAAECTDWEPASGEPGGRMHLAWTELRELLPALGARRILLAHLGEEARAAAPRIEAEAGELGLHLTVCDDGTSVVLSPRFTGIEREG